MANPYEPPREESSAAPQDDELDEAPQEVSFELTIEDVVTFQLGHYKSHAGRGRWVLVVIGVLLSLVGLMTAADGTVIGALLLLLGLALVGFGFWVGSRLQLSRALNELLKTGRRGADVGDWTVSIEPQTLSFTTAVKQATYRWQALERVVETPEQIILYTTAVNAIIVPRRAFGSAQRGNAFYRAAARYLERDRQARGEPLVDAPPRSAAWRTLLLWLLLIVIFLGIWILLAPAGP